MRRKKNEKWKTVLAVFALILLLICTYIAFIGQKLLPEGLIWQICAEDVSGERVLEPGVVAIIDRVSPVALPAIIAFEQDGKYLFGMGTGLESGKIVLADAGNGTPEPVESDMLMGRVTYTVAGLGYAVTAIQDFGMLVLGADLLVIALALFYCAAAPKRREGKRREELIKLFEFYGEKYDLEDAGVDF